MGAVIKAFLGVLFDQLINVAMSVGVPAALKWIDENPKVPWYVKSALKFFNVSQLLIDFMKQIKPVKEDPTLTPVERKAKVKEIKVAYRQKARAMGSRVAHASDTKGLG